MFVNWTELMNMSSSANDGDNKTDKNSELDFTTLSDLTPSRISRGVSSCPKISVTGSDHVSRTWEGVPLTEGERGEDGEGGAMGVDTIKEESEGKDESSKFNPIKYIKMMIPHMILLSMLLSYLTIGAVILQRLETQTELKRRAEKLVELRRYYVVIGEETWRLRGQRAVTEEAWKERLSALLLNLSQIHEDRPIKAELEKTVNSTTRWTFPTALLYVLTVLTTCGYGEVDVNTNGGKIFAVAFALIGIPLMFITAADIGKFLSETLLKTVSQVERCWRNFLWCCCRRRPSREKSRDALDQIVDGDGPESLGESLLFPIGAYVTMISLYCCIGALLFTSYEVEWSFIHAFHFGFNLIVTVGLGDIVVQDGVFLCLIVAYVIIGLSVVTMCVDLASTHLKAYFTKIHYYGQARSRLLGMTEDVREMMQLLSAMRGKKGGKVTWNDLREFMESEHFDKNRPFIPRDINKLKWVDETSSAISTLRHNSMTSDVMGDSQSSLLRKPSSLRKSKRSPDRPPPLPAAPSVIHESAGLESQGLLHDC